MRTRGVKRRHTIALYEYICPVCTKRKPVEVVHGMTEEPEIICEKCSGIMVRKISLSSFIMKTGGTRRASS